MSRNQILGWVGLAFGAFSVLAIIIGVSFTMLSNTEANQETLERVRVLAQEGPTAIQSKLTTLERDVELIDQKLDQVLIEVVRGNQCQ